MIKTIVLLTLCVFSANSFSYPSEIDNLLESNVPVLMKQHNAPGIAIGLLEQGTVGKYYFFGHADLPSKEKLSKETGFNVGSISKSLTAWGVMKLVEQGKVELDAPVQNYITRWIIPKSPYDASGITIRRLLSHTSGISQHAVPQFELNESVPTLEVSLSQNANWNGETVRLTSSPGESWAYSGGGYTLLQLMIEEVTKKSFATFMEEEILHPLRMFDSSFEPNEEMLKTLATSYGKDGKETARLQFAATGSAGLQTTPNDLAIFANASLSINGTLIAGRDVLKPETVSQMVSISSNAQLPNGQLVHRNYGLGYFNSNSKPACYGQGGDNRGWHSRFILFPTTKNGIIILTNSSNGFWLAQDVYCLIVKELVGGDTANCS